MSKGGQNLNISILDFLKSEQIILRDCRLDENHNDQFLISPIFCSL